MPGPASADRAGLAGARVLVLGATGLIGGAVVRAAAAAGAVVAVHGCTDPGAARRIAEEVRAGFGVPAIAVHGDVTDTDQMSAVADAVRASGMTALDLLVVCVTGYRGEQADLAGLDVSEFRRVLDVDLVGAFVAVQAVAPLLAAANGARVVLLSSLAAVRGRPGAAHLCAAKAGVQGLALALARDLQPDGVRVNCLAPGPVLPSSAAPSDGRFAPGVGVTSPEQVAATVLSLGSGETPLNGQLLVLNGGRP